MGLDILAYSGLRKDKELTYKLNKEKSHLEYEGDELIMYPQLEYIEETFPNRANPLKYNGDAYNFDSCESFNIGSYSTYNSFRQELEMFADSIGTQDFDELINFSDCEGVIGCILCQKLYDAFDFYEDEFEKYVVGFGFTMRIYRNFKHAFKIGKDNGAVEFC